MIAEIQPTSPGLYQDQNIESVHSRLIRLCSKLSRVAIVGLITVTSLPLFLIENGGVAQADALNYPYPTDNEAPCEFGVAGGESCTNPNDSTDKYDWGVYVNGVFHQYRNGYEYRNCTDYVQWKEGTLGVSVPSDWKNGGQWYDNAPDNQKSTTAKAWDAAIIPTSQANPAGHVAFVESVNNDGTITVSEYNHDGKGDGDVRTGKAGDMGFTEFIDFGVHPKTEATTTTTTVVSTPTHGVPGDFNGDDVADAAIFRPEEGGWHIRGVGDMPYGRSGDIPVPGDYDGDKKTDVAVYRPSEGGWHINAVGDFPYGQYGDIPVPGDYDGNGADNAAVYRPSNGTWHIRGVGDFQFGQPGDIPVPGDYDGNKTTDIAIYRPSEGGWHIRGIGDFPFGTSTDIPVQADYNGDGKTDPAIFRPSEGGWHIRGFGDFPHGASSDIPLPGYYKGNKDAYAGVFRPSDGGWHIREVGDFPYGRATDIPANQTLNAYFLKLYGLIPSY